MPVGGHRLYQGPGLGIGAWACPACGHENVGPLGPCARCGSGQLGRHEDPAAPPRPSAVEPPPPREQRDGFTEWRAWHPDATMEQAYTAGYIEGMRDARKQLLAEAPPVTADVEHLTPEGKPTRTIVAALTVFRDQVLVNRPEEVASGEWCSAEEVTTLIAAIARQHEARHG